MSWIIIIAPIRIDENSFAKGNLITKLDPMNVSLLEVQECKRKR